jgi:hypothetical protein
LNFVRNRAPVRPASHWALLACMAALLFILGGAFPVLAGPQWHSFTFGLWGDLPYGKANDAPKMPALIADMNASDIAFSFFDGDTKDGSSKCTNDVYDATAAMFNRFKKPMIYVLGDNEWTDCHRLSNGGYDNIERLNHIRKTMFAKAESFGLERLAFEQQGELGGKLSENLRFFRDGVMFVGLNIPGSNNNRVNSAEECSDRSARTSAQCDADNAEWAERDAANIAWMHEAFVKAKAENALAVMLVIQADPGFDIPETEHVDESRLPRNNGYWGFLDALIKETKEFSGQVVLVHGDVHYFKIDKPLQADGKLLGNFTRVETFGSPHAHWVHVTVDPASREVFTFRPMIVPANK